MKKYLMKKSLVKTFRNRIPMTAGQAHQDHFEQLRTRNRADELHLHDLMSDWPLSQETWFSGLASMSNREFQGKYVHFNVFPKYEIDQQKVSKPGVHEIAPHCVTNTSHETGLTPPQEHSLFSRQACALQAYTSHVTTYHILHLLQVRYHSCTKIKCSPPSSNLKTDYQLT